MSKPKPPTNWLHRTPKTDGVERIEAFFSGHAYELHRHDTYAIGRTLTGVQSFQYRGGWQHNLPGRTMVLHPDEAHDGEAGTEEGFKSLRGTGADPANARRPAAVLHQAWDLHRSTLVRHH